MTTNAKSKPAGSVLVVDDEKNMRVTLRDILEAEGYDVETAASGEEAIVLCRRRAFDVVLMDVRMPDMNGVDAFREIRRLRPAARVILMSAYSVDELRDEALKEGAIAFLEKPLDPNYIVDLIGEAKDIKILVVESEEDTAKQLRDALRKRGFPVTVTYSPQEALELVNGGRFDLVFLDADLPAMNGLDLYLAIKKITPSTAAIMMAGRGEAANAVAREAVRHNVYAVVRKPLDIPRVLGLLERILRQRAYGKLSKPKPESE